MPGEIEVSETILRRGNRTVRPLARELGVMPGGLSASLQRLVVDFGAECSFRKASERIGLHHRIGVSATTVRKITLAHARRIERIQKPRGGVSVLPRGGVETIVTAIDGTMLPMVETAPGKPGGGRKNRRCHWKETRLAVARVDGEVHTRYGVSTGEVQEAGHMWAHTVAGTGWGTQTHLHAVSDGAAWIRQQCADSLGRNVKPLLDFYHVCEYLAAVATSRSLPARWLQTQKRRLKANRVDRVLAEITPWIEADGAADEHAPVRAAKRYLENHRDQLDYKGTLEKGLPIGSGLIEAAHRHVLQKRLKISGAWWSEPDASSMAHLRVLRANEDDGHYWQNLKAAA